METEHIQTTENVPFAPAGGEVAPEPTEVKDAVEVTPEAPVAPEQDDHDQEIADIQAAIAAADTPEKKKTQEAKLNTKFAEMRRARRDAKTAAEEARIEAARWKGRAEALAEIGQKKEPDQVPVPPAPVVSDKPKEEDFTDYTAYIDALTDWKVDKKMAGIEAKVAEKEAVRQSTEAERARTEADKARNDWLSKGKSKFKDFDAVVTKPYDEGGPAISAAMAEVINGSEISHELAYHLAKNQAESRRIAALSPMATAKELGKLEEQLTSITPVKPKTQTNAPVPIVPITGDRATAEIIDLEKLSPGDYIAYQNRKDFGGKG